MLKPAQLYREELSRKLTERWYEPRYKYYFSGSSHEMEIPRDNESRHDFVHLDKNGEVDGYFSYRVDWWAGSLYNFGLIGFADNNALFLRDCVRRVEEMVRQGIRRAEFWAWADNPVNKFYERVIEKYDGRIVGRLHQSGFFDGEYHDTVIYEIIFKT